MRPHPLWILAACTAGGVAAFIACVWPSRGAAPTSGESATPAQTSLERWCADGLEPIEGGGCLAAPSDARAATMIVYLHGLYSPDTVAEELDRQARVAKLGTSRGFAVLALRGLQGECKSPELKDSFCWPSNERTADDGPAFVSRWTTAMARARDRIGPGSNVLLGFSNGGYFAELIVKRALARFDAVVVAHAGPVSIEPVRGATVPVLLITADSDLSDPDMQRLDDELTQQRWPHAIVAREGGHGLLDWDVESALTFFSRASKERLPFSPPLTTRSRRPRLDAATSGDDASVSAAVDAGVVDLASSDL